MVFPAEGVVLNGVVCGRDDFAFPPFGGGGGGGVGGEAEVAVWGGEGEEGAANQQRGIGVSDEERDAIQSAIDEAKEMAETVRAAAGDEEPLYGVIRSSNLMREGTKATLWPFPESGEHLKNAPATKGDYFKVANILESP